MKKIKNRFRSLKLDLSLVMSSIIIVLVILLCGISFFLSNRSIKELYLKQMTEVNEDIAKQLEGYYKTHEQYAKFFSKNDYVIEAARTGFYEEAGRAFSNFFEEIGTLENIFISTAEIDTEIMVDGVGGAAVGLHWGGDVFDKNIEMALEGELWISDAYPSPVTNLPIVLITAPIIDNGDVVGIFGLPFDLGALSAKLVEGKTIGKTGYPYIASTNGTVLAHPNPDLILNLNLNDLDFGIELLDAPSRSIISYVWEGKEKYQVAVKNEKYGILSAATINNSDITDDVWSMAYFMFAVGVMGIILIVIVTLIFMYRRLKPLTVIVDATNRMAEGQLDITLERSRRKVLDETGLLLDSFNRMLNSLKYKAGIIDKIASNNITMEVKIASDKDTLGQSLVKMTNSLNTVLGQVNQSVDQVSIGADQVAQSSQSLSQGATEQASSLEEVSASITQINSQSRQNAENATEANNIAKQAADDAENGNKQMANLSEAMGKINTSSDQIKKIVKVIDDIAFQTNLLALNANVEAARAGKYGKGFAVVADEVRNLAVRSAEAVKETTEMVDDSINNIESGNKAVEATAIQLESIMGGSSKVADFLEEIATASNEQAEAIEQITKGLDQIDQVTQSNTASAEESAAAAEELASQSVNLKSMVSTFKLKNGQASTMAHRQIEYLAPEITQKQTVSNVTETGIKSVDPSAVIVLDDDDFDRF